jgi:diguanylate cyclase (GGDEF)-like protein
MSAMKDFFVITEHRSETISSLLRWFFVIVCVPLFYYEPIVKVLNFNTKSFPILLTIAIAYMTITQVVLWRCHEKSVTYRIFTRGGLVFDFIVYTWLMILTGSSESPFIPVGYLIVIHAAIYWRLKGSITLAAGIFFVLVSLFIKDAGYEETKTLFHFFIDITFLWLIALYGGVLASKERQNYVEKNMYQLQSVQDYLTGLSNHRKFQEDVLAKTKNDCPFALVLCDIDHFKKVNDVHGHIVGDEVLKLVAGVFSRYLPSKEGTAYRYGGEEFTWIMHTNDGNIVKNTIEKVNAHLREYPYRLSQGALPITLSYGIAMYQTGEKPSELIKRADTLLYEAKTAGRNTMMVDSAQKVEIS